MVLQQQDTQRQRLRDAGKGDEIAWFGRRDGSVAIDLPLIDAFLEGVEVCVCNLASGGRESYPQMICQDLGQCSLAS